MGKETELKYFLREKEVSKEYPTSEKIKNIIGRPIYMIENLLEEELVEIIEEYIKEHKKE